MESGTNNNAALGFNWNESEGVPFSMANIHAGAYANFIIIIMVMVTVAIAHHRKSFKFTLDYQMYV